MPQEEQNRTVSTLTAQHPDFPGVATVGTVSFEVLFADVDNPAALGPNNKSCSNGGTRTDGPDDGTAEFDLAYECTCATGFTGPNCEDVVIAVSASSSNLADNVRDRIPIRKQS